MQFKNTNWDKASKNTTLLVNILIIYLFSFAIAMAFFQIRPFWNDEWRLSYNIKFKTLSELWGRLDLLQQCPRTYLSLLKIITAKFDYSYTALRLPPLIISCASILMCFQLRKKIFPENRMYGNLFILILISSQTFTDYLVQVKHYEVDIFLCLLALWQLIYLIELSNGAKANLGKFTLLCISFLIAPYFSYVYPITIAPIFIILFLKTTIHFRSEKKTFSYYALLIFPLLLATISIAIFYIIDVKQLMADSKMYESYLKMLHNVQNERKYWSDLWYFFALVGSGLLFEIVFGIIGSLAFLYSLYLYLRKKQAGFDNADYIKLYAILLILITLALVLSGKILGGVARLTSFTVPSIALLIAFALVDLKSIYQQKKITLWITAILFIGLSGNITTTCINTFTYPEYTSRINTFRKTGEALALARKNKIPIMITEGVRAENIAGHVGKPGSAPGKITNNTIDKAQIEGVEILCAEAILKIHPAYKTWDSVPVFCMPDMKWNKIYVQQLPEQYTSAVVFDGLHYEIVYK